MTVNDVCFSGLPPHHAAHSKRDRHAKTLDIAQEEVLTCLGIHIFERLHHIWQKLRCEEQTWLILFYIGVDALQKSYQVEIWSKFRNARLQRCLMNYMIYLLNNRVEIVFLF